MDGGVREFIFQTFNLGVLNSRSDEMGAGTSRTSIEKYWDYCVLKSQFVRLMVLPTSVHGYANESGL